MRRSYVELDSIRVTAAMLRAGREAFLRDDGAKNIEAALERAFRAMERRRRDELEERLRHRLGAVHG